MEYDSVFIGSVSTTYGLRKTVCIPNVHACKYPTLSQRNKVLRQNIKAFTHDEVSETRFDVTNKRLLWKRQENTCVPKERFLKFHLRQQAPDAKAFQGEFYSDDCKWRKTNISRRNAPRSTSPTSGTVDVKTKKFMFNILCGNRSGGSLLINQIYQQHPLQFS